MINSVLDANEFEVLGLLGTGGAGSVYKARQIHMDRVVAVKVLHTTILSGVEHLQRFQREAHLLENLQHPNIVRFYKFGTTADARPYVVLEYLEGKSLQELLKEKGKLSFSECLPIFEQILAGVSCAHENGIVHRDLKPSNVLLLTAPHTMAPTKVKLLDFGLAKPDASAAPDVQKVTKTGAVLGTPLYMSPEQCAAQPSCAASDIYAIGCMLYECLTGSPPFNSDSYYAVLMAQMNDAPPEMEGIDRHVQSVVMQALQKTPSDRFASVSQFKAALQQAGEGKSKAIAKSTRRSANRRTNFAYVAASIILLAGFASGAWIIFRPQQTIQQQVAEDRPNIELQQDTALREKNYAMLYRLLETEWAQSDQAGRDHLRVRLNKFVPEICNSIRTHFFPRQVWEPDGEAPASILHDGVKLLEQAEKVLAGRDSYAHSRLYSSVLLMELSMQPQREYQGVRIGGNFDKARAHYASACDAVINSSPEVFRNRARDLLIPLCAKGQMIAIECLKQGQIARTNHDEQNAQRLELASETTFDSLFAVYATGKVPDTKESRTVYFDSARYLADLAFRKGKFAEALKYYQLGMKLPESGNWNDLARTNIVRCELMLTQNQRALKDAQALYKDLHARNLTNAAVSPFLIDYLYGWALLMNHYPAKSEQILRQALEERDAKANPLFCADAEYFLIFALKDQKKFDQIPPFVEHVKAEYGPLATSAGPKSHWATKLKRIEDTILPSILIQKAVGADLPVRPQLAPVNKTETTAPASDAPVPSP